MEVTSNEGFIPEPEQANLYHVAHNLIRIEVSNVVDDLDQVKSFLQICCLQKPVCQILQVHEIQKIAIAVIVVAIAIIVIEIEILKEDVQGQDHPNQ